MNSAIPKSTQRPIYQLKITPEIKQLERAFNTLKDNANRFGWTRINYREYHRIRLELKNRCKESYNRNWEDKINKVIEVSKDTKAFWRQINLLKGHTTNHTNYLEDNNGNRYYSNKERCNVMEKSWKDIFRITEEEQKFDALHSEHIGAYINIHNNKTTPYPTSDLTRLNSNCFYTRPINKEEIIKYLNRIKNKAPGFSKINKTVIEKCTKKTIDMLTNIFNACLSTGLFPTAFKKAVIRFIPKEGKSPKDPMNYRPISLLETPGKLYEKVIQGRLNAYLNYNSIIKNRQHGFRPKRGTNTAITIA